MGNEQIIFPLNNRLKGGMKKAFNDTIFHGGTIVIDEQSGQKKMRMKVGDSSLPFMTWSAGQKEFMPLLMAIYCLTGPVAKTISKEQYKYVIIEEPEMGLHPKAIQSVISTLDIRLLSQHILLLCLNLLGHTRILNNYPKRLNRRLCVNYLTFLYTVI